ncbi:MAG: ABC transporter permease [Actinomycetaceae bacterium]|nr:ABC transporter permease [Arcanobacterium sp.]MDD7504577.1 ABC transporter permease [Actinomycetaceae bacterium]MDY6143220.1 ABC transporter permease [Arcanobacterium sp.]
MNNLLRLIGRRLIALPIMAIGVTILVFFLMELSPIDPAWAALGDNASDPGQVKAFNVAHGYVIDDGSPDGKPIPVLVRYWNYLVGLFSLDFGIYGVGTSHKVIDLIAPALPVTLQLTFFGLIIAVLISFPLGVIAALYRDRWPDQVIRVLSVGFIGTPSFWLAALLVLLGLNYLQAIPVSGPLPRFTEDFGGWAARMFLPAVALATPVIGQMTRVVRTSVVEELDRDYVRTALGAGIPRAVVISRNVLRNALITPVTVLGLRVGYLMGGAVVIEIIFGIQGMGKVLVQGVQNSQVEVVQAAALVVALAFIVVNIIVDMLYLLINPRIRSV